MAGAARLSNRGAGVGGQLTSFLLCQDGCVLCRVCLQAGEGAAGGSSEGAGMDEDPSLTEEEDNSDSEPHSECRWSLAGMGEMVAAPLPPLLQPQLFRILRLLLS